jgi:hypothetical protein
MKRKLGDFIVAFIVITLTASLGWILKDANRRPHQPATACTCAQETTTR